MTDTRAIIINVDTRPVTVLAVLSIAARCPWPLTIVECSRSPEERDYFRRLAAHLAVDFVERPLRPHGETLDLLFQESRADRLLLVDSDAELLDAALLPELARRLDEPRVYGAGFRQEGNWAVEAGVPYAWYAERMWIPFCLLETAPVREALAAGVSFMHRKTFNDLAGHPLLSRMLAARRHLPLIRHWSLDFLAPRRAEYFGVRPAFIFHDTGADLHAWMAASGYRFGDLDWSWQRRAVAHHHGVTRRRLRRLDRNSTRYRRAEAAAREAIQERYPDLLPERLLP